MSADLENSATRGISWVAHDGRVYFSEHSRKHLEPHSSMTQLIQGIWESRPEIARLILRNRISTTEELSPMNWGMLKTAAQRASRVEFSAAQGVIRAEYSAPSAEWIRVSFETNYEAPRIQTVGAPMKIALGLKNHCRIKSELYLSDRSVGCVAAKSGIVAWAHNTNQTNRCLHAEVNLIQSWWRIHGKPMPQGTAIHTTLQPCRMCLGMIEECVPGAKVIYAESDGMPPAHWGSKISVSPGLETVTGDE